MERLFAGLPPPFAYWERLNPEKLFTTANGTVLHQEREKYTEEMLGFQDLLEKLKGLRRTVAPSVKEQLDVMEILMVYMNDRLRAEKFLQAVEDFVSEGNEKLAHIIDGLHWGLNGMFCGTRQQMAVEEASTHSMQVHDAMVSLIEALNGRPFELPSRDNRLPDLENLSKDKICTRSNMTCEVTGARFLKLDGASVANCISGHIIPHCMFLLKSKGYTVYTWLLLAILLPYDQFQSVWNECATYRANDPANLLLLLDDVEFSFDRAQWQLFYANPRYHDHPILQRDYISLTADRTNPKKKVMGLRWLIQHQMQPTHWTARRINCASGNRASVIPPNDETIPPAMVRDKGTFVEYLNFSCYGNKIINDPSPVLLDARNILAEIYQMRSLTLKNSKRHAFPVHEHDLWRPFYNEKAETTRSYGSSTSRQRRNNSSSNTSHQNVSGGRVFRDTRRASLGYNMDGGTSDYIETLSSMDTDFGSLESQRGLEDTSSVNNEGLECIDSGSGYHFGGRRASQLHQRDGNTYSERRLTRN